jgi:hypothetical protein
MKWLVVVMALGLAVGCVKEDYRGESQAPTLAPYRGDVAFLDSFPRAGSFRRLGVITVETYGFSYEDTLTVQIKKSAAARGANAVVLQAKERTITDSKGRNRSVLAGWAIRISE